METAAPAEGMLVYVVCNVLGMFVTRGRLDQCMAGGEFLLHLPVGS